MACFTLPTCHTDASSIRVKWLKLVTRLKYSFSLSITSATAWHCHSRLLRKTHGRKSIYDSQRSLSIRAASPTSFRTDCLLSLSLVLRAWYTLLSFHGRRRAQILKLNSLRVPKSMSMSSQLIWRRKKCRCLCVKLKVILGSVSLSITRQAQLLKLQSKTLQLTEHLLRLKKVSTACCTTPTSTGHVRFSTHQKSPKRAIVCSA